MRIAGAAPEAVDLAEGALAGANPIFSRPYHAPYTLAVIRRETGSWTWMGVTFGYMLVLAYAASFATYNIAVALGAG